MKNTKMVVEEGLESCRNVVLELYVAGATSKYREIIEEFRTFLESTFSGNYELTVLDIIDNPQAGEDKKILATPTLIKKFPAPEKRIIGDLSLKEYIIKALGLENMKIESFDQQNSEQERKKELL